MNAFLAKQILHLANWIGEKFGSGQAITFGDWIVTTSRNPMGCPAIDKCFTRDANGVRYEGQCVLLDRRMNEHGEHLGGLCLVVAKRVRP